MKPITQVKIIKSRSSEIETHINDELKKLCLSFNFIELDDIKFIAHNEHVDENMFNSESYTTAIITYKKKPY